MSGAEDIKDERVRRVLAVLTMARGPVPLGYLSLHTGIEAPLELLEEMRRKGLVRKCPSSTWSCSLGPMYEIAATTKECLQVILVST
jgi:hypothetical protein